MNKHRGVFAAVSCVFLAGCISTQQRPMNHGEDTSVSMEVAQLLEQDIDGEIDIREHPEVRCVRHKRVGTHMVTRHCYTRGEQDQIARESQDGMRDRFGKQVCLDGSLSCKQGSAFDPLTARGIAGPNSVLL